MPLAYWPAGPVFTSEVKTWLLSTPPRPPSQGPALAGFTRIASSPETCQIPKPPFCSSPSYNHRHAYCDVAMPPYYAPLWVDLYRGGLTQLGLGSNLPSMLTCYNIDHPIDLSAASAAPTDVQIFSPRTSSRSRLPQGSYQLDMVLSLFHEAVLLYAFVEHVAVLFRTFNGIRSVTVHIRRGPKPVPLYKVPLFTSAMGENVEAHHPGTWCSEPESKIEPGLRLHYLSLLPPSATP